MATKGPCDHPFTVSWIVQVNPGPILHYLILALFFKKNSCSNSWSTTFRYLIPFLGKFMVYNTVQPLLELVDVNIIFKAKTLRWFFWCLQLRAEDILLRGLKWSKLLDPEKKGQWWLSGDVAPTTENIDDVATTINMEVLEAQKLVQLAAAQRMNTDLRRAIFCIIMSGEDYIDAFEKLLRLDLSGKQVYMHFFLLIFFPL